MSILTTLLGSDENSKLSETDIAMDMAKDSKFGITSLSMASAEATNPQLRQLLKSQLDTAINEHFELSDLLIKKGWYPAFAKPEQQLKTSYDGIQNLTQKNQG
jgi:similar to spore coat protein